MLQDSRWRTLSSPLARLVVTNPSGYTQVVGEGEELGRLSEVSLVEPNVESTCVKMLSVPMDQKQAPCDLEHCKKIRELMVPTDVAEPDRSKLIQLLEDHNATFSLEDGERGKMDMVELEIDTGDAKPRRHCARRMPFAIREEVSRQLKGMQSTGVIQPSSSPWASPVVMVRKKDCSHRFCVDYRELNSATQQDLFPLPRIDDLLDQLDRSHYFSTLDLISGYWQIRVHPESVPKTAFVTPQGSFEFTIWPHKCSLSVPRLMQRVLQGLNPEKGPDFVSVYIDDVLAFSPSLEDHLEHLKLIIDRLQSAGLKPKPLKCHLLRMEVEYLGHVVTPQGLKANPKLISAVREFPVPCNLRETRQFLGLCS